MRKLILSVLFSVFYIASASAEVGLNIGVAGNAGLFTATGNEKFTPSSTSNNRQNDSEHGEAGWGSIFVEKTLGDVLAIGVEYVPDALETETAESTRAHITTAHQEVRTRVENKIQVDFEDLTTYYLTASIGENLYVKAGMATVEIITNESLGTGGAYGNTDMDGSVFGVGYNYTTDNGAFIRVEGNYMTFDGTSLTNNNDSEKVVKLKNLDGVSGKISIGKSF